SRLCGRAASEARFAHTPFRPWIPRTVGPPAQRQSSSGPRRTEALDEWVDAFFVDAIARAIALRVRRDACIESVSKGGGHDWTARAIRPLGTTRRQYRPVRRRAG